MSKTNSELKKKKMAEKTPPSGRPVLVSEDFPPIKKKKYSQAQDTQTQNFFFLIHFFLFFV